MSHQGRRLMPISILLACVVSSVWASKSAFNIYDDLLASPQFRVLFPEEFVLELRALELLRNRDNHEWTFTSEGGGSNTKETQLYMKNREVGDAAQQYPHGDFSSDENRNALLLAYEEVILRGHRYLCQIPEVPPGKNKVINETVAGNSDETNEVEDLAKATERGLEMLREMEGKCMYYVSGWWSYSFCYMKHVKQFHALPSGGRIPSYPPVEDPETQSYVLGRFPGADKKDDEVGEIDDESEVDPNHEHNKKSTTTDIAELQTKGGSRYLVQRLEGGTKCDLTGKDRKIEIEFHCHPQSTDRIGMIKEVTTCSYLMVIYTPRLCNDVAFQPAQKEDVHNVECREILTPDEVVDWEAHRKHRLSRKLVDSSTPELPMVGGIQVGAKKLVGSEGRQIEKGMVASTGEGKVEVVAWRMDGEVHSLNMEELKKFGLDPADIDKATKEVEDVAEDKNWRLEYFQFNGEQVLRAIVEDELGSSQTDNNKQKTPASEQPMWKTSEAQNDQLENKAFQAKETAHDEVGEPSVKDDKAQSYEDREEGSKEEFYKDEL